MLLKTGERWHCTNPACHTEIRVEAGGEVGGSNPRCCCGAVMKKRYEPPALRYLEFLRAEAPPIVAKARARGE